MIPVFSTGLHCDVDPRLGLVGVGDQVIPVFSTGLHCDIVQLADGVHAAE